MMYVKVVVPRSEVLFDLEEDDNIYDLCKHSTDIYVYKCDDIDDVLYFMDFVKFKFADVRHIVEVIK